MSVLKLRNRLRVWDKVDWIVFPFQLQTSSSETTYYLQYTNFLSLSNKESVIVSPVITVHTLRKKGEIQNPYKTP